jgi:hypothetical protein
MEKPRHVSIHDLTALGGELSDDSLRQVSGSAATKHVVMEPILVWTPKPATTCTSEERSCDTD